MLETKSKFKQEEINKIKKEDDYNNMLKKERDKIIKIFEDMPYVLIKEFKKELGENMIKKVFISQFMRDKSDEAILKERKQIENYVISFNKEYNIESVIIDSFLKDFEPPADVNKSIAFLSESLKLLSTADMMFYSQDYAKSDGTFLEYEVAKRYGIELRRYPSSFTRLAPKKHEED